MIGLVFVKPLKLSFHMIISLGNHAWQEYRLQDLGLSLWHNVTMCFVCGYILVCLYRFVHAYDACLACSASAWQLHLIAHSSSTVRNVNGGQLMSDTVHHHLHSHHPWEKIDEKLEKIYQGHLRSQEHKTLLPLLYCVCPHNFIWVNKLWLFVTEITHTHTHTAHSVASLTWDCCVLLLTPREILDYIHTHRQTHTQIHKDLWPLIQSIRYKAKMKNLGSSKQDRHVKRNAFTHTNTHTHTPTHTHTNTRWCP